MNWNQASFVTSAARPHQFPNHHRREIALAGRSNVGKSSLINRLLGRKKLAAVGQQPGRTRTLNFYSVGSQLCLVDLPGYGYAKVSKQEREKWNKVIEAYISGRDHLIGVMQVIDIRHSPSETDQMMAEWLRQLGLAAVAVATKADKLARGRWRGHVDTLAKQLGMPVLLFSAQTGEGRQELRTWIRAVLDDAEATARLDD